MTPPPAIAIRDLRVVRGGRVVLHGLSLDLPAGQVTGLLGPSGCGKTTLMRAIMGIQLVASGTVEVLGRAAGSPALRREIGYMTQAPATYADLTVGQNLGYFASLVGAPSTRVAETLDALDLAAQVNQRADRLSGGQRARLSLATALLGEPRLLVLDEPTVGLDPVLRRDIWGLFRRLAEGGATLLVSSHVMDEAERCDHLLLMREGRLLGEGSPAALRARTGAADMEGTFLRLVEGEGAVPV